MYHWNSFNHGKKWDYFSDDDDDDNDGDGKYNNNKYLLKFLPGKFVEEKENSYSSHKI